MFISEWTKFDWFVTGLIIGCFWKSAWYMTKRIIEEFKIAKEEWRKGR